RQLVRTLLAKRSGMLALSVSEEGATIKVDGTTIGVSPLPPQSVAGGAHTLEVEREGFIRHAVDFDVAEGEETRLKIRLLPSEDYKRTYTEGAERTRRLAYIVGGGGAAVLAGGVVAYLVGRGAAASLRADVAAYNAAGKDDRQAYDALVARRTS